MKKNRVLMILMLIILLFNTKTTPALASDDIELVPKLTVNSVNEVDADKYSTTSYAVDTEEFGILDVIPKAFNGIVNLLFFLLVWLSKFVNYALTQAFTLDIFSFIDVIFDKILHSIRDAVYKPFLGIVLPITGLSIVFFAAISKSTRAISLIVQTILILVVAAIFMTSPSFVITMVNDMSKEISGSALAATATVVTGQPTTGDDAIVNLSNIYWNTAIMQPWQILQFGKTVSPSKVEEYLSYKPGSPERKNLVSQETGITFTAFGQIVRLAIVLFLLIVNVIMGALILGLAGMMFLTQFAAIFAGIMAVLGFTLALLPNQGLKVAIHAIYNVFEFLMTRLAITVLLCIYFAISTVLYANTGWFIGMILQLSLIATVIIFRKKIFSFVYASTRGSGATISAMERNSAKDFMVDKAKLAAYGYGAMRVKDGLGDMHDKRVDRKLTKRYEPTAEKYLYKQYDEEKRFADNQARESGKPVQYSDFVKKTEARVDRGFVPFALEDVKSTTNMMKNLHRQGEDPDRLVMTTVAGKTDNEIRHDQRNLEYRVEDRKDLLKTAEDDNERTYDRVVRGDKKSEFYDGRRSFFAKAETVANKVATSGTRATESRNTSSVKSESTEIGYSDSMMNQMNQQTKEPNQAIVKPTADGTVPQQPQEKTQEKSSKAINEVQMSGKATTTTNNEIVNRELKGSDVNEVVNNNARNEKEMNETRTVNTVNEATTKENTTQKIQEVVNNQNVTEHNETQIKNVETVNKEVSKEVATNNTHETINNTRTTEKTDFINISNVVNNENKELKNTISNVSSITNEKNETVNNKVANTENIRNVQNIERDQEFQQPTDSGVSNRRTLFDKLDKFNKKEES